MSASWSAEVHPRRGARSGARLFLLALVILAGLLASHASGARRSSRSIADSGETVQRIRISQGGIVVERGSGDSIEVLRDRARERVRGRVSDRVRRSIRSSGGLIEIDDDHTGVVRIFSDAVVPAGTRIDGDVVAVCGSVDVAGEVTGDVVAVLGSVTLRDSARVHGDAVSIGGGLDQAEGASIDGESVSLGFTPFTWGLPALPVMMISIAAGWLVSMFVGWIFVLLFPTGVLRVATVVERRPAASFFLGVLSVPMFFVVCALLFVTVIGIPLGILLPMLYVLVGYAGQLTATSVLGARLLRRSLVDGLMMPLLAGTAFVAVLLAAGAVLSIGSGFGHPASLFFTLSGSLLLLGLGALGTGAFLLSRFGTRPREVVWSGQAATPPMAAAPGAAVPPISR